jgi:hypothetical protein
VLERPLDTEKIVAMPVYGYRLKKPVMWPQLGDAPHDARANAVTDLGAESGVRELRV